MLELSPLNQSNELAESVCLGVPSLTPSSPGQVVPGRRFRSSTATRRKRSAPIRPRRDLPVTRSTGLTARPRPKFPADGHAGLSREQSRWEKSSIYTRRDQIAPGDVDDPAVGCHGEGLGIIKRMHVSRLSKQDNDAVR